MKANPSLHAWLACACLAISGAASASDPEAVRSLQRRWAEVKYAAEGDVQQKQFESLVADAAQVKAQSPGDPDALICEGLILPSPPRAKRALAPLPLSTPARSVCAAAIWIGPAAMGGSAYTSLGSLYYQVPGWPLGFGNDDKAREMLRKGLAVNPDGIDANYFYGHFLLEQGEYADAVPVLEKALAAPARPGRELADQGRRSEIEQALAAARAHGGS